jgi:RimJ/RimL family protein N-acetyltransferase
VQNPFLIGTRVYLRPLERSDAPAFVTWLNDPEVTRTLKIFRPLNLATEEEFLGSLYEGEGDVVLGIAVRESDALIGSTGLHRLDARNRHASFGLAIGARDEWGKGYGTEASGLMLAHAFETLNLNRVWLHVYEYNPRAIALYGRVGFKAEGVLRQDRYHAGRYWDTVTMAILRSDWEAGREGGLA